MFFGRVGLGPAFTNHSLARAGFGPGPNRAESDRALKFLLDLISAKNGQICSSLRKNVIRSTPLKLDSSQRKVILKFVHCLMIVMRKYNESLLEF